MVSYALSGLESLRSTTLGFDNFVVLGHSRTENSYNLVLILTIVNIYVLKAADLAEDIIGEAGKNKAE